MTNAELRRLARQEAAIKQELKVMKERFELNCAPLVKQLAEIDAVWPKTKVVWRDLETNLIRSIESKRVPVPKEEDE
jgi:hypothetical protein